MKREEFIAKIERYFDSWEEAEEAASDYTDEQINDDSERLIRDIRDDYNWARYQTGHYESLA